MTPSHSFSALGVAIAAAFCLLLAPAFAADPLPTAAKSAVLPLSQVQSTSLPALDSAALADQDAVDEARGLAPRYAVPVAVRVTPDNAGTWETIDAATRLWRYRISAPDAVSLNLGFTRYRLPEGASLFVYSPDLSQVRGPFTAADNETHGQLWTPLILGSELVIELTVPAGSPFELELGQIGQGYRSFGQTIDKSGSCNMDVACLAADDPWRNEMRAVGVISTGGSRFCSGSLLNNTAQDHKMYFMTANHCGINAGNAPSLVVFWNYQNSTCRTPGSAASGQTGNGSLTQFNTGSNFRAANAASDFTLVELDDPANPAYNLYWAGWDRSTSDFPCSAGSLCATIHHPNADEKRITFSESAMPTTSYNGSTSPGDGSHVHAFWDSTPVFPPNPMLTIPAGVTEPGSSGSPLYNAQHLFIGQLHGGPSACGATGNNLSDYYGRFSVSWTGGGTSATRVSDWLDSGNTGVTTLTGFDPNGSSPNQQPSFTAADPPPVNEDAGVQTIANWSSFNPGLPAEVGQTATYTVSNVSNPALLSAGPSVAANGTLGYTPAPNANGSSAFTVTVQDSGGTANGGIDTSSPQTFTITVNAVNDAPSFTASDPPPVNQDAGAQLIPNWAVFNPGAPGEAGQTATYTVSNVSNPALFSGGPSVAANGMLTYTSTLGVNGSSTFQVRVKDSGGVISGGVDTSAPQAFTITVKGDALLRDGFESP
ncbi:MAG: Ig-like domain-containing protein [Gammaproteobacteria bacterium]